MDFNTIANIRKEVPVRFQEEIVCGLVENKCLVTMITFLQPHHGSPLDCYGQMHCEGLDPIVEMRRSIPAIDSREMMEFRAALRALMIDKLLEALAEAEEQFSRLELVCGDGHLTGAAPVPRIHTPRPDFLPQRPTGEPSKHSYLGAIVSSTSNGRPAGGYLSPRGYQPTTSQRVAPVPAPVKHIPTLFGNITISTNYTAIEQSAARILHLKEAIRGLDDHHR